MKSHALRHSSLLLAGLAVAALSACSTVAYRCPLDPNDKAESPTACANMHDAMEGAKRQAGGRTSVFLDDQGRIVPREIIEQRTAQPLASGGGTSPGFFPSSGQPVFIQPKQFQVWTGAYQDAEGNLHDGHHSWFTTPGRWSRGTVSTPGDVGKHLLAPAQPSDKPKGRILALDPRTGKPVAQQSGTAPQQGAQGQVNAQQTAKDADAAALKALSQAANSSASNAGAPKAQVPATAAPGITAPAVQLRD